MALKHAVATLLTDPLSEPSRAKRRALLVASAVGILIVKAGLIPAKFETLGLDFDVADQRLLARALLLVVLYLLFAFTIYAVRNLMFLRALYLTGVDEDLVQRGTRADAIEQRAMMNSIAFWQRKKALGIGSWCLGILRWCLDFLLPVVLGVYAVLVLWTWSPPPPKHQTGTPPKAAATRPAEPPGMH